MRARGEPGERSRPEPRDRRHRDRQLPRPAAHRVGERRHGGEQEAGDEALLEALDHQRDVERVGIGNHAERVEGPYRAAGQREYQSDGKENAIGLDRARRGTRGRNGGGVHGGIEAGFARQGKAFVPARRGNMYD
jgi:hypothetical protein